MPESTGSLSMLAYRPTRSMKRRSAVRRQAPVLEICEDRLLLSLPGLLQGVVYISGTSQVLPDASVSLEDLNDPSLNQTTTTNANGVYSFQNLSPGPYRITETPPTGYVNDSSQPNSPLTKILNQTPSSIDVQLSDLSQLQVSYPSRNEEVLTLNNNGEVATGEVGQANITVNEPDVSYTTPLFPTFCVDFYRDLFLNESNVPYQAESLAAGLAAQSGAKNPQNAGEIAYLYNDIGSTWSTDPSHYVPTTEAAGLQLALWELQYESNPPPYNVTSGTFSVQGLNASSPEVIAAQNYLTEAQGQNELALYLNGLPTASRPGGSQGLIAPMSLNFTNSPMFSTTPNPSKVTLGSTPVTLNDTADLQGGNNPSGTITFTLYQGSTLVDTETKTVNGNGTYTTPTGYTLPTSGTVIGTYQWNATYSGDTNNSSASDNGNTNEQVVVGPAPTAITTTPNPTSVTLGTSPVTLNGHGRSDGRLSPERHDHLHALPGQHPGGHGDDDSQRQRHVHDTDRVHRTDHGTVTGTYQWNATYSGDTNNSSASDNGNTNEQVVVSPAPRRSRPRPTRRRSRLGTSPVTLKDTADLTGGYHPSGTITFTLYQGSTLVDTETVTVNGNGTYTTPTGYTVPTTAP